ncbi:MAG: FtsX-like permease family protein [Candidatus Cloacimonadota bacterium]|nr:FtsX-like permease family protein [Candidatus Cloacimonadota bacterium]
MLFKLAYKNIIGAGFRTWLNVFILSLAYFAIISLQGFFVGWSEEASREIKAWDIAEGQFWQQSYDPLDPFTLDDAHGVIPAELAKQVNENKAVPILLTPATIYPDGRMKSVLLKGIKTEQQILELPTKYLQTITNEIPAIIGSKTAKSMHMKVGDFVTIRWRDKNGVFDAIDVKIAHIFSTTVLTVDNNQIWISLSKLQEMLEMPDEATIIVCNTTEIISDLNGWNYKSCSFLLKDLTVMIKTKTIGSSIFYILLLFMAMIAIFDTQVLAIFRRRKEMGTMMALGIRRIQLIALFTLEGIFHALLAIIIGAIYGIPLLNYFQKVGMAIGTSAADFGLSGITDSLYPVYGWKLVAGTIILVLIVTTIVSYLPSRKIAKLEPTDALRGKMTK